MTPSPPRRPALTAAPVIPGFKPVFLGGLHRSGTSVLHRLLRAHPEASGFVDTGVPEDEGQFLQSLYAPARRYGGQGRFAFDPRSHLTEQASAAGPAGREQLLREWGAYHQPGQRLWLEKSPPNLIRSRFLQALFPEAAFIFIVRHPVAAALATQKWIGTTPLELLLHWHVAHRIWLQDLPRLQRVRVLRYEDLCTAPAQKLAALCQFLDIAEIAPAESVDNRNNGYFERWQAYAGRSSADHVADLSTLASAFGYHFEPPWVGPLTPTLREPLAWL